MKNRIIQSSDFEDGLILKKYRNDCFVTVAITQGDIKRIQLPRVWLNDDLISLFMLWALRFHHAALGNQKWTVFGCPFWLWRTLIDGETHKVSKFFHPVLNIFDYDILLIQINWGDYHWGLVAIVNHTDVIHMDSVLLSSPLPRMTI